MNIANKKKSLITAVGLGLALLGGNVMAKETLTIGTDLTYPPYNYLDGKTASGFDADFMRLVAIEMGEEAKFLDTRFANLVMGVNLKKFDVIASTLYVTPERAKQIDYIPYMKTGGVILALKDAEFSPSKPVDLCGKRVSSIQGAAWIKKLNAVSDTECLPKGLDKIDVREFPTSPEASQAVIAGMVDAQFEDAAVARSAADKSGKLALTSDIIYPVVVGLGVKKGNAEFKEKLASAVASVKKSDAFKKLLAEYSVSVPNEKEIKAALDGSL
ncbi:MAG: transporter substrate-binding domain-containing protein [Psychromonas sp.]